MKRDAIVTKVRKIAEKADVSNIDFLAVQINLTDQDHLILFFVPNPGLLSLLISQSKNVKKAPTLVFTKVSACYAPFKKLFLSESCLYYF